MVRQLSLENSTYDLGNFKSVQNSTRCSVYVLLFATQTRFHTYYHAIRRIGFDFIYAKVNYAVMSGRGVELRSRICAVFATSLALPGTLGGWFLFDKP